MTDDSPFEQLSQGLNESPSPAELAKEEAVLAQMMLAHQTSVAGTTTAPPISPRWRRSRGRVAAMVAVVALVISSAAAAAAGSVPQVLDPILEPIFSGFDFGPAEPESDNEQTPTSTTVPEPDPFRLDLPPESLPQPSPAEDLDVPAVPNPPVVEVDEPDAGENPPTSPTNPGEPPVGGDETPPDDEEADPDEDEEPQRPPGFERLGGEDMPKSNGAENKANAEENKANAEENKANADQNRANAEENRANGRGDTAGNGQPEKGDNREGAVRDATRVRTKT